jgi:hypothetical protein
MPLSQEDKDWFTDALSKQKTDLENSMKNTAFHQGKRLSRLEHAFNLISRAARSTIVATAKKDHDALLRAMFDNADLLLIPPFESGARKAVSCDIGAVQTLVGQVDPMYDVELNRSVGFRLVHKSRSAQVRRKAGAAVLQKLKSEAPKKLGLNIQYDKPWELRVAQTQAHKFLKGLQDGSGGLITSVGAKGGFLSANGVRLAPEFLVPMPHRWPALYKLIASRIRNLGNRQASTADTGALTEVFESEFAADQGVVDLETLDVNDYDAGLDEDDRMSDLQGGK